MTVSWGQTRWLVPLAGQACLIHSKTNSHTAYSPTESQFLHWSLLFKVSIHQGPKPLSPSLTDQASSGAQSEGTGQICLSAPLSLHRLIFYLLRALRSDHYPASLVFCLFPDKKKKGRAVRSHFQLPWLEFQQVNSQYFPLIMNCIDRTSSSPLEKTSLLKLHILGRKPLKRSNTAFPQLLCT